MYGLKKFGAGIGFHRILSFCAENDIDLPYLSSVSIAVTGSKGKGSTVRFAYHALMSALGNAACFISPHLLNVTERYECAGQQIPQTEFDTYKSQVLAFANRLATANDSLGEFELLFLIALLWFNKRRPTCIIWEAGIGGRYDPIRVLRANFLALTSIELEHTDLLGPTHELIAYDKLDAVRPGGQVFISPAVPSNLYKRLSAYAEITQKSLTFLATETTLQNIQTTPQDTTYTVSGPHLNAKIRIPLIGQHQIHNSLTALAIATAFLRNKNHPAPMETLITGLQNTQWPGRLEQISTTPNIWIDVGHTPESVRAVCDEFLHLYGKQNAILIFGVSYNKAAPEMVAIIEDKFDHFILTSAHKNGMDTAQLRTLFTRRDAQIETHANIQDALSRVRELTPSNPAILVAGGLFLSVEFAFAWRGGDPATLQFF